MGTPLSVQDRSHGLERSGVHAGSGVHLTPLFPMPGDVKPEDIKRVASAMLRRKPAVAALGDLSDRSAGPRAWFYPCISCGIPSSLQGRATVVLLYSVHSAFLVPPQRMSLLCPPQTTCGVDEQVTLLRPSNKPASLLVESSLEERVLTSVSFQGISGRFTYLSMGHCGFQVLVKQQRK